MSTILIGFSSSAERMIYARIGWRGNLPVIEIAEEHTDFGHEWKQSVDAHVRDGYEKTREDPLRTRKFQGLFPAGTRCAYCLCITDAIERDHIDPFSAGGTESYLNIAPACRSCNARKHAKSLLEFVAAGGLQPRVRKVSA